MNSFYCYILKLNPLFYRDEDWTEKETDLVSVHFDYLKDLNSKGIVFLAGRTVTKPMTEKDLGIVIIDAASEEEARIYMENDPAVAGKLMSAEFFEFSLALLRK